MYRLHWTLVLTVHVCPHNLLYIALFLLPYVDGGQNTMGKLCLSAFHHLLSTKHWLYLIDTYKWEKGMLLVWHYHIDHTKCIMHCLTLQCSNCYYCQNTPDTNWFILLTSNWFILLLTRCQGGTCSKLKATKDSHFLEGDAIISIIVKCGNLSTLIQGFNC